MTWLIGLVFMLVVSLLIFVIIKVSDRCGVELPSLIDLIIGLAILFVLGFMIPKCTGKILVGIYNNSKEIK